ncbi:MAG TPA: biopolymer transporter ExbD [Rhizomicrobium sp.]|nr:biopolymer transporter ExbD [Rhizomicrobium sp.]
MAITLKTTGPEIPAEINTTPLIDVMLVLLTLLIITVPMQTHAVKLDFGRGAPTARIVDTIDVQFDGTILWNGAAVDRAALDADLAAAAAESPQPELHVSADRLVRYDTVAKVMADAQRLGVASIGIVNAGGEAR